MTKSARVIKLIGALICGSAILFTACKKQEIQGPKGDPGTPGIGGNSNMTSSTFIVNNALWVADSVAQCLKVSISFTALTQDVVDKGGVKVYKQIGSVWAELPLTTSDLFTQFGFDVGHLYLNYINIEGGMPGPAPATANYRMVILSEVQKTAFPPLKHQDRVEIEKN